MLSKFWQIAFKHEVINRDVPDIQLAENPARYPAIFYILLDTRHLAGYLVSGWAQYPAGYLAGPNILHDIHPDISLSSRVEWFWNLHLAHLKMDSGWKSKTKIVKAFFNILRGFRFSLFLWFLFTKNHLIGLKIFFSQTMTLWVSKIRNVMEIKKMGSKLSDKMHLKEDISKKQQHFGNNSF